MNTHFSLHIFDNFVFFLLVTGVVKFNGFVKDGDVLRKKTDRWNRRYRKMIPIKRIVSNQNVTITCAEYYRCQSVVFTLY